MASRRRSDRMGRGILGGEIGSCHRYNRSDGYLQLVTKSLVAF